MALQHVIDVVIRTSNGDRRAPNVILAITDNEAYDDETVYINSMLLREEEIVVSKVMVYLFGILRGRCLSYISVFLSQKAFALLIKQLVFRPDSGLQVLFTQCVSASSNAIKQERILPSQIDFLVKSSRITIVIH